VYLSNFNRTETYWASMTCCFHNRSCGNWVETRFVSCMWSYIRAWASPHTWANNTTSRCQLLIVPTRRDRPWSLRSSAPNTPRQFLSCDLQKLLYAWQDEVFSYGLPCICLQSLLLSLMYRMYVCIVTNKSIYCGFLTTGFIHTTVLQLFPIGGYESTIHCCCCSNTIVNF
jgi:hypothetical protein